MDKDIFETILRYKVACYLTEINLIQFPGFLNKKEKGVVIEKAKEIGGYCKRKKINIFEFIVIKGIPTIHL